MAVYEIQRKVNRYHRQVEAVYYKNKSQLSTDYLADYSGDISDYYCNDKNKAFAFSNLLIRCTQNKNGSILRCNLFYFWRAEEDSPKPLSWLGRAPVGENSPPDYFLPLSLPPFRIFLYRCTQKTKEVTSYDATSFIFGALKKIYSLCEYAPSPTAHLVCSTRLTLRC